MYIRICRVGLPQEEVAYNKRILPIHHVATRLMTENFIEINS